MKLMATDSIPVKITSAVQGVFKPILFRLLVAICVAGLGNVSCAQSSLGTIGTVSPKIVKIFGAGGGKALSAYGSGFLVSPNGHIVTVWSHVLDSDRVTVVLHDGRKFVGRVLAAEPALDMAVLKIDAEGLPYFDLANTPTVSAGSRVLGFSNAYKIATGDEPVSVIHGVIAAKTTLSARRGAFESPYTGSVYVVDAVTNNSGAAGGVLTTWDGRLVGMIGKELKNSQTNTWLNYVMPIGELRETIEQIVANRFASRKKEDDTDESELGKKRPNRYEAIDFGIVTIPNVVARTPAYIDRVLPGSLAEAAGLRSNDLILFVDENLVQTCTALRDEFARVESGDRLKVVVRRDDKLVTVELTVPKKSAD